MGWPALPYRDWAETCSALHLWTQIVGKYRLAHTPWLNHSWHATLYVTPRGLTTGMVPDGKSAITLTFDFHDHALIGETADMRESFPLEAMSVADFLSRTSTLVQRLGGPDEHSWRSERDSRCETVRAGHRIAALRP